MVAPIKPKGNIDRSNQISFYRRTIVIIYKEHQKNQIDS